MRTLTLHNIGKMMNKDFILRFLTILFLALPSVPLSAQNGLFDVLLDLDSVDCSGNQVWLDIRIRASSSSNEFFLNDQNFRFTFDTTVFANPAIETTYIDGLLLDPGGSIVPVPPTGECPTGQAFYNAHTMTGSTGDLVSYNITRNFFFDCAIWVTTSWISVGRVVFDIKDPNNAACFTFSLNQRGVDFPYTRITEVEDFGPPPLLPEATDNQYIDYSNCLINFCPPLPVELLSFSGQLAEKDIQLDWVTAVEVNSAYFELLRSTDGEHFIQTGEIIPATGFSTDETAYRFLDKGAALLESNELFYRLRQYDTDGRSTILSKTVSLNLTGIGNMFFSGLYPNPASDKAFIEFSAPAQQMVSFRLYNPSGQVVWEVQTADHAGFQRMELDLRPFPTGVYYLKVSSYGESIAHKVLIE
jgi:hypothetical protein